MPRYVVQRTFPEGLQIPGNGHGAELCQGVVEHNAADVERARAGAATETEIDLYRLVP